MASSLEHSGFFEGLIDPFRPTRANAGRHYRFAASDLTWGVPLGIGLFMLVVAAVGWVVDPARFYFAYLIGWAFCLTITLGSLFFVLAHHITKAHWGVVIRRVPESLTWAFPLLAVLSIPILLGMHDLYHWTHHELYVVGGPEYDALLAGKRAYLNTPFWITRLALYFFVWTYMSYRLYKLSLAQDLSADEDIPDAQRKVAAWGIPVFAVTTAFASYDILMSVDPHWFSTIFGVYIFSGAFWSANAMIILIVAALQRRGQAFERVVTTEHFHDLGKWLFAFTVFWAYIAFSQYMLIWYANIPEETFWYRHRLEGGWGWHSAALLIAHFILPFILLLPRASKRILPVLAFMAVWALVMQWFDLNWLVMPAYQPGAHAAEAAAHVMENGAFYPGAMPEEVGYGHAGFHWVDFACWFGLFGVYLAAALYRLSRHSVVPRNDPRLNMSLNFHNA